MEGSRKKIEGKKKKDGGKEGRKKMEEKKTGNIVHSEDCVYLNTGFN